MKKQKNKVLAIDCSTQSIAYAFFENKNLLWFGEISFPGKGTLERLPVGSSVMHQLYEKFAEADVVVFESAAYLNNRKTVILLAMAYGSYISPVAKRAEVHEVSAMSWQPGIGNKVISKAELQEIQDANPTKSRTWVKNKGREMRKQRTIDIINKRFKINVISDNVADSIGLGIYWIEKNG